MQVSNHTEMSIIVNEFQIFFGIGFWQVIFEDKENNEDDLLNKGGLALMCNSESIASPSESDTIADSWCLENPVADESDMNRCVCVE